MSNQKYGAYYPHTLLIKNKQGKALDLAGKLCDILNTYFNKGISYLKDFYKNEGYNIAGEHK